MSTPSTSNDLRKNARELLCMRCQRGDRKAWEELVAHWERPLFYYVRRMARSEEDALQILQDTWFRVFSSFPSLTNPARLAPWLYTITRRVVLRYIGEFGDDREALTDVSTQDMRRDSGGEVDEEAEAVHWGLAQLAPVQREVLVLFYLEDLSLTEMAEVLAIPVGTVKSRLNKARSELKAVLERMEKQDDGRA